MLLAGAAPDKYVFNEYGSILGHSHVAGLTPLTSGVSDLLNTSAILIFGQSNMATSCGTSAYTTINSQAQQINIYDGALYPGVDPVFGATVTAFSSITMRLADRIISQSKKSRVIMGNCSVGGTTWDQWANGDLFSRIAATIWRFRAQGIEPNKIISGLGETDGVNGTIASSITSNVNILTDKIRALGCNAPIYLGKYTIAGGSPVAAVRTGIDNAIDNGGRGIYLGFDCDTNCPIAGGYRYDGVHLNNAGLDIAAPAWQAIIYP